MVTPLRKATSYEPRTQCLIGACTSVRVNHFLKSTLNEDEVLNNFDTLYRETIRDIFCIPLIGIFFFFFFFFFLHIFLFSIPLTRYAQYAPGGEKEFFLNVLLRVFIYADDVQVQWDMLPPPPPPPPPGRGGGWDLDLNPMQTNRKHCHFVPALCQCTSTSVKLRTGICSRIDQRFSTFLNSRTTLNVGFFFGPTIPKIGKNYREICRDSNP